jgi:hypothetical protein
MKNNDFAEIILELEDAGASKKEAEELSLLSQNISNLFKVERSVIVKNQFLGSLTKNQETQYSFARKWLVIPLLIILSVIFLGSYTVASAQKSLPGEPLYPVKILSENIAAAVVPGFKGEILQRRSEEIKTLSQQNNSQNSVNLQKTINSYEKTLKEDGGISATNIEESRKNLEEASKSASLENKKEIENVIRQTDNTQQDIQRQTDHNKENSTGGNNGSSSVQDQIQNKVNTENPLDH